MIDDNMPYNVATYKGAISVTAGHDIILNGGVIQSATGSINIYAQNDLDLYYYNGFVGTIRTTGELTGSGQSNLYENLGNYWNYANGGNISIHAGGNVNGSVINSARHRPSMVGIPTMSVQYLLRDGPRATRQRHQQFHRGPWRPWPEET